VYVYVCACVRVHMCPAAMYPRFTFETRNDSEQVIEESKLKPSFIMITAPASYVQFDYENPASIYLCAQGTVKG